MNSTPSKSWNMEVAAFVSQFGLQNSNHIKTFTLGAYYVKMLRK